METSDFKGLHAFPAMQRLVAKMQERKAWEALNSEPACACHTQSIASAWGEAMAMDHERERQLELRRHADRMAQDAVFQLNRLGVPARASGTLSRLKADQPGPRAVRSWLGGDMSRPFLVLLGSPGTGKTVAAAYAVQLALSSTLPNSAPTSARPRDPALWVASADLASLSSFTEADRQWFERLKDCGLLVLDDLGAEQLHDSAQQRLERLIDERYGNSRRTVITTNATDGELSARVGARIWDRFREAGRKVNCGNQSLRGVKP